MKRLFPLLTLVFATSCSQALESPTEQSIVDSAIAWQNGDALNRAEMTFDFRERHFRVRRFDGLFEYERTYVDSTGVSIREVLSNDGLTQEKDGVLVELDSAAYASAETAVNSVVYFALLPLPLNDEAARKRYLGQSTIDGLTYEELEVTFSPEGGGRDHDDRFVYWMNRESGSLDFMAYYYYTNDGGSRFRKAVNVREIAGVRVADYLNFKADSLSEGSVEHYDSLYTAGELELVSEINLENVQIRLLPE